MKKSASCLLVSCSLLQLSFDRNPADAFPTRAVSISRPSRRRSSGLSSWQSFEPYSERSYTPNYGYRMRMRKRAAFKRWNGEIKNRHHHGRPIARLQSTDIDSNEQEIVRTNSNSTILQTDNQTTIINSDYPPTPTFLECMKFALPALAIYICSPLMSLIDASFIGRLSTSLELAALGPASAISDSAPLPLLFLSIATTNLIAKSYAQQDETTSTKVSRTALGMGTACAIPLAGLVFAFAGPISSLYCIGGGQATKAQLALASACTDYVAIRALALPAVVVQTIAQAICIGTKDTKTPMISVAFAAACNLLGDLILVRGFRQGIVGAAWATAASQFLAAGLLLKTLNKRGILRPKKVPNNNNQQSTTAIIKQLLSFIPFLFIISVKIGWHNSCTATAASLGSVSAAAHTALSSVVMVCMVLGDVGSSLSQAFLPAFERASTTIETATTDKNNNATKKDVRTFDIDAAMPTVRQLLKCTISISACVTAFAAVAIGFFGGQITSDHRVVTEMKKTLPWILGTLCFHGSAVTLEGLLLSCKKFRPLTICYSVLAVTVLAFQIAIRKFGLGLAGVWGCYLWFCSSRVVAFSILGGLLRPWWHRLRNRKHLSDQVNNTC